MTMQLLKQLYRALPYVRELPLISDHLREIRTALAGLTTELRSQHSFTVSRFCDFELPDHPRYSDPKRLLKFAFQACSQNGEDGMIHEIFQRIGTTNRTFVEIGVGDGNENNTAFLLPQGWSGYWIDGSQAFYETLTRYDWARRFQLKGIHSMVTKENVSELLSGAGVPTEFDYLSIDVDQNTYHVWKGLEKFRPRVVSVEYNATFPPTIAWAIPYQPTAMWDGSQQFGASLKAFELLGGDLGYHLIGCDFLGINAFFVRRDLCADHFLPPFTAENHYEPLRYGAHCRRGHPVRAFDTPEL